MILYDIKNNIEINKGLVEEKEKHYKTYNNLIMYYKKFKKLPESNMFFKWLLDDRGENKNDKKIN
jgi:sulfur relay (sulfurtransferase) DsrC/TusE family protein